MPYKHDKQDFEKSDNNKYIYRGLGFFDALVLVFIVLKLCNVINWSWIWVLSPIWIPVAILSILLLVCFILSLFEN